MAHIREQQPEALRLHLYRCDCSWYYSLEYSNYDYTGKEIRPAVYLQGTTEGIDFTVGYKDNINAGTAQVIITGIGNYSGTYTLEFTINPVTICKDVSQLQSKHPYDENAHEVYVYNGAEGAENLSDILRMIHSLKNTAIICISMMLTDMR